MDRKLLSIGVCSLFFFASSMLTAYANDVAENNLVVFGVDISEGKSASDDLLEILRDKYGKETEFNYIDNSYSFKVEDLLPGVEEVVVRLKEDGQIAAIIYRAFTLSQREEIRNILNAKYGPADDTDPFGPYAWYLSETEAIWFDADEEYLNKNLQDSYDFQIFFADTESADESMALVLFNEYIEDWTAEKAEREKEAKKRDAEEKRREIEKKANSTQAF